MMQLTYFQFVKSTQLIICCRPITNFFQPLLAYRGLTIVPRVSALLNAFCRLQGGGLQQLIAANNGAIMTADNRKRNGPLWLFQVKRFIFVAQTSNCCRPNVPSVSLKWPSLYIHNTNYVTLLNSEECALILEDRERQGNKLTVNIQQNNKLYYAIGHGTLYNSNCCYIGFHVQAYMVGRRQLTMTQ